MRSWIFITLLFCQPLYLFSQPNYSKEVLKQIEAVENGLAENVKIVGEPDYNIGERMRHYKVKGLSIAVIHNYKVVWAKGYGWANEDEKKPVTTETLFEPGSISKSLNAVGVLKLVQDKRLDLYTDINTYLTSWKFPYDSVSKGKKITLAQLLSHTAGLSVHGFPGYDREAKLPSLPQILNSEAPTNTPAVRSMFEPGIKFKYSGGGTTISQLIVTDVTKQAYDAFMYENVLKPMGMKNSFFSQPPPEGKQQLCASGYNYNGSAVPHKFHVYPEQAAAGLWATPTELCKYIVETQLAYAGKSAKVLNKEMTQLRLTPYNDVSSGLGVFLEKHNSTSYFQHGAGNEGFSGIYYGSLEDGNGVAIFINSDNPLILHEVVNSVATVYKWKDFYTSEYKKAIAVDDSILQAYTGIYYYDGNWASIFKKGDGYHFYTDHTDGKMYFSTKHSFFTKTTPSEKTFTIDKKGAVTGYTRKIKDVIYAPAIKITQPDILQLDKEMLNEIAWHLLEQKHATEAIPYLRRSLVSDPNYLLAHGNLAHCYLLTGDYPAAINIYKAHLKESIDKNFSWEQMIQQDFLFFKGIGYDTGDMNRVLSDLSIDKPNGF